MKKQTIAFVLAMMLPTGGALAANYEIGTQQSQFGYQGWPVCQPIVAQGDTQHICPGNSCTFLGCTGAPILQPVTPGPVQTAYPTARPVQPSYTTTKPTTGPMATPTTSTTAPLTDDHYTMVSSATQEQAALKYINEEREKNGLAALPLDGTLSAVARKKSQDMVNHHYFAHISPTLGNANKMLTDSGYAFVSVGENIGRHASVEKAHAAFMSSTAHKRNILGSQWEKVGIGIALDANGYPYITQLFVR